MHHQGAFASTTQLGEERVAVEGKSLSQHKTGHNKLETLEIRCVHFRIYMWMSVSVYHDPRCVCVFLRIGAIRLWL